MQSVYHTDASGYIPITFNTPLRNAAYHVSVTVLFANLSLVPVISEKTIDGFKIRLLGTSDGKELANLDIALNILIAVK